MDLTKEQQDFFKHFTSNMRTHLLEFAKFLTSYKSDVYLVMSRKATSLISAMIDLGILHLHGQMVSDKILDMKLDWLRDKKVTIIDDVIISGTTINRTIGKLETIPVEQVKVAVIAVNQKWFEPDLFTIEHTRNSYLLDTYISLNDSECIQFCANVVASFLTLPRPYDLDFPYYKNQKITEKSLYKILSNNSFEAINITTISQKKTGVYSYSLFPSEETISNIDLMLGLPISKLCLTKIRIYTKIIDLEHRTYNVSILPMIIIREIWKEDIDSLFDRLYYSNEVIKTCCISPESKLRVIQYHFSSLLIDIWKQSVQKDFEKEFTLNYDTQTMDLLFPKAMKDDFLPLIHKYKKINFTFKELPKNGGTPKEQLNQPIKDNDISANPYIINATLYKPFYDLLYDEEISARSYVKKFKKAVFTNPECKKVMDRLTRGYSIEKLESFFDTEIYDKKRIVSLFIDQSVDLGIIVPVLAASNDVYRREYRHGEDVLFGKKEEWLCHKMLFNFQKQIQGLTRSIQKIWIEKLLVLFIKYGCDEGFFEYYSTKEQALEALIKHNKFEDYILSIKYYLLGAVSVKNDRINIFPGTDISQRKYDLINNDVPFREGVIHGNWLSEILEKNKSLRLGDQFGYIVNEPEASQGYVPDNIVSKAEIFGKAYGKIYKKQFLPIDKQGFEIEELRVFDDDDITILATINSPESAANALAAETEIFLLEWKKYFGILSKSLTEDIDHKEYYNLAHMLRFDIESKDQKKESKIYEALDSSKSKIVWFVNRVAYKILSAIKQSDKIDEDTVRDIRTFWSSDLSYEIALSEACGIAIRIGNLNLQVYLLLLLLDKHLRLLSYNNTTGKKKSGLLLKSSKLKLNNEITSILDVLSYIGGNSDFLKEVESFLNGSDETFTITSMGQLINTIHVKVRIARQIIDEAVLCFTGDGNIQKIEYYQHLLYFETDKASIIEKVMNIFKEYTSEYNKNIDESKKLNFKNVTTKMILLNKKKRKGIVCCIAIGGNDSYYAVLKIIESLIRDRIADLHNLVLYSNMKEDCRIISRSLVKGNEDIRCNSLDEKLVYINEEMHGLETEANEFIEVSFNEGISAIPYLDKGFKEKSKRILQAALSIPDDTNYILCKYSKAITQRQSSIKSSSPVVQKNHIDVVMVVATKEEEDAILLVADWSLSAFSNGLDYFSTIINNLSIALVRGAEMRETDAAIIGQTAISELNPKYIAMAGFCAGQQGKVQLGDIIVPKKVYRFGEGKRISETELLPEISSYNLIPQWALKVERFGDLWRKNYAITQLPSYHSQEKFFMERMLTTDMNLVDPWSIGTKYEIPHLPIILDEQVTQRNIEYSGSMIRLTVTGMTQYQIETAKQKWSSTDETIPATKLGVLATGPDVQEWSGIFNKLSKEYDRKTIALDMEAHAIAKLAETNQRIPWIIAKGIGDFAKDGKSLNNSLFVPFASQTSFLFIVEFLTKIKQEENSSRKSP